MILGLVLSQFLFTVSAVSPPEAPGSVEVEAGLLRWSPAEGDSTYSVESRRFLELSWSELSQCAGTTLSFCNVSAVIRDAIHGCVGLRVRAQRGQDRSEAVEACSVTEDTCTPQVNLSASSTSITVHLTRFHSLQNNYAHSAKHSVCYWSLDRPRPVCIETLSSVSLPLTDQDPGRTYCVTVQYLLYKKVLVGLPHCPVCIEVPRVQFEHKAVVLGIVLPLLALALGSGLAYVLIFHRKKVKKMAQTCTCAGVPASTKGGRSCVNPQ